MDTFLLNILFFLGVIWMLGSLSYILYQCLRGHTRKEHKSLETLSHRKEDISSIVGKSKSYVSEFILSSPMNSSLEKRVEKKDTFVSENALQENTIALEEKEKDQTYEESRSEESYIMEEVNEGEQLQEELLLFEEEEVEASSPSLLSKDLELLQRWSRKDESVEAEVSEVQSTKDLLQGTDIMERYMEYLKSESERHRQLLSLLCESEREEEGDAIIGNPFPMENNNELSLSEYL